MADTGTPGPAYAMGVTEEETQRLIRQSQTRYRGTRLLLQEAGVTTGMRVLDVGSGAGDVSMLAADLVGPTGSVVGLDRNPAIIETARERARAAGLANVSFVVGEIADAQLDGDFDAVIGRFVLMHNPDPVATLRTAATRCKPGGVIAFQELDFTSMSPNVPPSSLHQAT